MEATTKKKKFQFSKMKRGSFLKVVPTPYTNLKGYF